MKIKFQEKKLWILPDILKGMNTFSPVSGCMIACKKGCGKNIEIWIYVFTQPLSHEQKCDKVNSLIRFKRFLIQV